MNRREAAFAAALTAATATAFGPLLGQPFFGDDIDLIEAVSYGLGQTFPENISPLWQHCQLEHYYRPLVAPAFLLLAHAFGLDSRGYRVVMLLLHLAAAWGIFATARRICAHRGAAAGAAAFYALSWIHWDTLSMISNIGQLAAHALFWPAVALFLDGGRAGHPSARRVSLGLAAIALFLKEDAVLFPVIAGLAVLTVPQDKRPRWRGYAVFLACSAAYVLWRVVVSRRFMSEAPSIAGLLHWRNYSRAASLVIEPLWRVWPDSASLRLASASWEPGASIWAVAALTSAAALAWTSVRLWREPGSAAPTPGGLILLALAGFAAGVAPYAAFDSVHSWNSHRLAIAWGAVSIALGALTQQFAARGRSRAVTACVGALLAWHYACRAIEYRFPNPAHGPFRRLAQMHETRELLEFARGEPLPLLSRADRFEAEGFPKFWRAPQLLGTLARWHDNGAQPRVAKAWRLRRAVENGRTHVRLELPAENRRFEAEWSAQGRL